MIQHVAHVLDLGPEVSGARRLILISLANHADEHGYCWPKRATIAAEAGLRREQTVTDHLTWLADHGYIVRHINAWTGARQQIPGHRRPNLYRLTWVPDASESGHGVTESV